MVIGIIIATTSMVSSAMNVSRESRLRQLATDVATSMLDCAVASINLPASSSAFPTSCGEQQSLLDAQGYSGVGANGPDALNPVTKGGVTFTVEQQVSPGNGSCSPGSGGAPPELEVNDWVTWVDDVTPSSYWWQGGIQGQYVEESTLVAVPAAALNSGDGNILVKITDDSSPQNGQDDVLVTVEPGDETATSTNEGCVLFTNLTPGNNYEITASRAGWIDSDNDFSATGPASLSMSGSVTAGTTLTVPYTAPLYYAQAATVTANYTLASPYTDPTNISSLPLSFYNTGLGASNDPYVGPAPGANGDEVFPFPGTSYYVVAGSCVVPSSDGNPGTPDTADHNATTDGAAVSLTPGGTGTATFALSPVSIVVQDSSGQLSGANVKAVPATTSGAQDSDCPTSGTTEMPTLVLPNTSSAGLTNDYHFSEDSTHYELTAYWEPGSAKDLRLGQPARSHHGPAVTRRRYFLTSFGPPSPSYSVSSSPNPSTYGQAVTLTVSGLGTQYVEFLDNGHAVGACTASSNGSASISTTSLPVGTDTIGADIYFSNRGCSSNPTTASTTSQVVSAGTLTSSPNPSTYGQSVTLSASGVSYGSSVEFLNGSSELSCVAVSSGSATATVSTLPVGTNTINASVYSNSTCSGTAIASLSAVQQTVSPVTLSSNPTASVWGESVTLTASGIYSGTVQFKNGSSDIGSCETVSGGSAAYTTSNLPQGTDTIYADVYLNASCAAPVSTPPVSLSLTVGPNTTTTLVSNPNPIKPGDTVTLTATVATVAPIIGTPGGTVAFEDSGTDISGCGSVELNGSGVATCTTSGLSASTSANPNTITAVYTGNSIYSSSTSAAVGEAVVEYASLPGLPYGTFLVWASSSSGTELTTNTTTAVVLSVAPAGTTEYTCTGGSYLASGFYSGGSCTSQSLAQGAPVFVAVK